MIRKFEIPSFEEFKQYCLSRNPNHKVELINDLYFHYQNSGWKIGKNKMKIWKQVICNAIKKEAL